MATKSKIKYLGFISCTITKKDKYGNVLLYSNQINVDWNHGIKK